MRLHTTDSLRHYTFDAFDSARVKHGVFTRHGGVSSGMWSSLNLSRSTGDTQDCVAENRARLMRVMDTRDTLTSWLVHGNHVRAVGMDDLGQDDAHADAMITRTPGLALTMRYADCVPILFHDRRRAVIGVAHAGWKGFVNGVLAATVNAMRAAYDCDPADIVAGVGPSIGPDKFEVGADVAAQIQSAVPAPVIIPTMGNPRVDLWAAAEAQLRAAGVGHIEIAGLCTATHTWDWFSHRAEQGNTGRFGVLISL